MKNSLSLNLGMNGQKEILLNPARNGIENF